MDFDAPITPARFGCTVCRRVFSSVRNFDLHRSASKDGRRRAGICHPPELFGMTRNQHGVWRISKEEPDEDHLDI